MLRPDITPSGMGWFITYSDEEGPVVAFDIDRIEVSPSGPVCTVTVSSRMVGARRVPGTDVLFTDRLYLHGSRAKGDFVRALGEALPPPKGAAATDWGLVMNSLVNVLMTETRRPLAPVDLSTVVVIPEPLHLIPGFLPDGKATILYGAGGTGKSVFAVGAAVAVQTGCPFAGWTHIQQANVLYLDWEDDEQSVADRVAKASKGLGLTSPAPVTYLAATKSMEMMHTEVARIIKDMAIRLVVVDSVGAATTGGSGGDLADAANRFFNGLRALGTSMLLIDHIASDDLKSGSGSKKPYGSVFKVNRARNTFELELLDAPSGSHRLAMRHRKTNVGARLDDRFYEVLWDDDSVSFNHTTFVPKAVVPLSKRILDALIISPLKVERLVEVVSDDGEGTVSENDVRVTLRGLLYEGDIGIVDGAVTLKEDVA